MLLSTVRANLYNCIKFNTNLDSCAWSVYRYMFWLWAFKTNVNFLNSITINQSIITDNTHTTKRNKNITKTTNSHHLTVTHFVAQPPPHTHTHTKYEKKHLIYISSSTVQWKVNPCSQFTANNTLFNLSLIHI